MKTKDILPAKSSSMATHDNLGYSIRFGPMNPREIAVSFTSDGQPTEVNYGQKPLVMKIHGAQAKIDAQATSVSVLLTMTQYQAMADAVYWVRDLIKDAPLVTQLSPDSTSLEILLPPTIEVKLICSSEVKVIQVNREVLAGKIIPSDLKIGFGPFRKERGSHMMEFTLDGIQIYDSSLLDPAPTRQCQIV